MPTKVYFNANDGTKPQLVIVQEEPGQVADAFNTAEGLPLRLTTQGGQDIYVNPGNVTFWESKLERQVNFGYA